MIGDCLIGSEARFPGEIVRHQPGDVPPRRRHFCYSDRSDTGGRLIAAGKVNGTAVYDARGEKIGNVYDIMIDKASGRADYAILNFGSFLGMGGRYHPLPWNQLTYDPGAGGFVVNLDKSRLEGAPSYADDDVSLWDDRRSTDLDTLLW